MEHVAEQKMWGEAMRRRADGLLSVEMGGLDDMDTGDASGMLLRFGLLVCML